MHRLDTRGYGNLALDESFSKEALLKFRLRVKN